MVVVAEKLLNFSGKYIVVGSTWVTVLSQEFTEVPELCGMAEPVCFVLDYSNKTLASILPDSNTLQFILQHVSQVEDVIVRLHLWRSLHLLVNNEIILPSEVLRTIILQFKSEESPTVREFILGLFTSASRMLPNDVFIKWAPQLRAWCLEMIQERQSYSMLTSLANILWKCCEHDKDLVKELYLKVDTGSK